VFVRVSSCVVFFFQAEDGIRDFHVTGVQTCALPILITGGGPTGVEIAGMLAEMRKKVLYRDYPELKGLQPTIHLVDSAPALLSRSEERRGRERVRTPVCAGSSDRDGDV